jgi:hypothetical protein
VIEPTPFDYACLSKQKEEWEKTPAPSAKKG